MARFILFILCIFLLYGCSEINPPGPERILPPWSGTPVVSVGESKDSIKDKWGEPDEIRQIGVDDVGLIKEEWIYRGRYPTIPVDDQYLSQTKRLVFTGNSLTAYETGEAASKPVKQPDSENVSK